MSGPSGSGTEGVQGTIKSKAAANHWRDWFEVAPNLSGYCMMVKKTKIKFPEEIPFYHNEIAFQRLVHDAGYRTVWAKGAFVKHLGSKTAEKNNIDFMMYAGSEQYKDWKLRNYGEKK